MLDDHLLFREGLSRLLEGEPGFEIVANCESAGEALATMQREPVDLVLLDYDLGEHHGLTFLKDARARGFNARVLIVTAGMSDANTLTALENGTAGIFLKHNRPSELVEAIHKVMLGETWLDPKAMQSLASAAAGERSAESGNTMPLSDRERAVLKGVFEGLTNKELAVQLDTTESSIKWVMQQLFQRTGARTRSQLVRIALERRAEEWLSDKTRSK